MVEAGDFSPSQSPCCIMEWWRVWDILDPYNGLQLNEYALWRNASCRWMHVSYYEPEPYKAV